MTTFVRAANPVWYFVDLVGLSLNDQYYISFLTNDFPYIPQPAYQDVNGTIPWANPLEFNVNGTLPDNLYFNPTLVYRLEIRQGPTQSDPLIYEINNFVPAASGGNTPENLDINAATNQVINPQFAQLNFDDTTTITTAGTYNIAPGWDLVLTGAGSTTLTQILLSGNSNGSLIGEPPFALEVSSSGWTTVFLQQTFQNNGALWSNGAIAVTFLGRSNTTSENVTVNYLQSDAGTQLPLNNLDPATLTTSSFQTFKGYLNLPASTNTDTSDVATTTLQFVLPSVGDVELTNIQIVGQSIPLPSSFNVNINSPYFNQESIERGIAQSFSYYQTALNYKPIRSLLTGWDFPLNPAQLGSTQTISGSGVYIWDQTIGVEAGGTVNITRNVATSGLGCVTTANNTVFYLLQYLTGSQVQEFINQPLSVNVNAYSSTGVTNINCKVFLFRAPSTSSFPMLPSTIGTINTSGIFTATASGWTEIPRGLYGVASADIVPLTTFDELATTKFDYGFSGWQLTDATALNNTNKFAIVVTFVVPTISTGVAIQSISLVPGLIPTRPAPQTADDVLRECQYYYEQSYQPGTAPGTAATNAGRIEKLQNFVSSGGNISTAPGPFQIDFKTFKVNPPTMTFYSPTSGTSDNVTLALYNNGAFVASNVAVSFSTNWQLDVNVGLYNAAYVQQTASLFNTTAATSTATNGLIFFQYVADARLGTF